MIHALLGTKIGQSQTFTDEGQRIPVTKIQAGPCWITHIDVQPGYTNVQLALGNRKNVSKPVVGHIKKAGIEIKPRFLRSIRMKSQEELGELKAGSEVKVADVFAPGDRIEVTGTSKGKGFAGVVKRHGFRGGPRTHGQSDRERAPGSIGQTTTPGRVYKGKRMAGRMGSDRVTVKGLRVVGVEAETNTLLIKGLVPGFSSGLLIIRKV